uniref:Reverse transcriptase domain-containing protein n=1 Tax=Haemonchus contortus TaxID=6289 RepID=A0A7I4Y0P3_HAECO
MREAGAGDQANRVFPVLPFPCAYYKPQEPHAVVNTKFRLLATSVYRVVRQFVDRHPGFNLTPLQRQGFKELRNRIEAGEIRLSVSDKGGEFVVIPQVLDKAITQLHLQDKTLYCRSTEKEYAKQYRKLNKVWCGVAKVAGLHSSTINRLKSDLPLCPVLYTLIKTHKLSAADLSSNNPAVFKVRPIISSVGGPTDKISWFLNLIVRQILPYIPAHLTNTNMLLEKLLNVDLQENVVIESFDVTSLYTNVSNEAALEATFELLSDHEGSLNLYGFSIANIMTVLKECLNCSFFRWSGVYYRQMRGLAMGQRLAPVLAIAYMSKIEKPILDRRPALYSRYIDDCLIICSSQEEMDICFDILNNRADQIKFTRESPRESWLPFLNIQIQLARGTVRTKWYRKPSCKNILIHYRSAHPLRTKQSVINNMFRVASKVSSDTDLKTESLDIARRVALSNGYPHCRGGSQRGGHFPHRRIRERAPVNKVAFCLPFISEEMSRAIRSSLTRCDLQEEVMVVEIPPGNLCRQLVCNRLYDILCDTPDCLVCPSNRRGDCMRAGVIYEIRCQACGAEYIGETGRPLRIRIKEHLEGLRKSRTQTPLGMHRILCHGGNEFTISVAILALETETTARKALEACWITSRDPQINRKEECVAVTRDLAPFLDLCKF